MVITVFSLVALYFEFLNILMIDKVPVSMYFTILVPYRATIKKKQTYPYTYTQYYYY